MRKSGALWAELERDAHRFVLDLVEKRLAIDDAGLIASRVLLARAHMSASMRDALLEPLAEVVRTYLELLRQ